MANEKFWNHNNVKNLKVKIKKSADATSALQKKFLEGWIYQIPWNSTIEIIFDTFDGNILSSLGELDFGDAKPFLGQATSPCLSFVWIRIKVSMPSSIS